MDNECPCILCELRARHPELGNKPAPEPQDDEQTEPEIKLDLPDWYYPTFD